MKLVPTPEVGSGIALLERGLTNTQGKYDNYNKVLQGL